MLILIILHFNTPNLASKVDSFDSGVHCDKGVRINITQALHTESKVPNGKYMVRTNGETKFSVQSSQFYDKSTNFSFHSIMFASCHQVMTSNHEDVLHSAYC